MPEYNNKEILAVKKYCVQVKLIIGQEMKIKNLKKIFKIILKLDTIAISNGTAGLYLAVKALNLKKNSEIIVLPELLCICKLFFFE